MSAVSIRPTHNFAPASQELSLAELTKVRLGSLAFYTVERFDAATQETLASYLQRLVESEDDLFSQSAVKSVPRSWRDL